MSLRQLVLSFLLSASWALRPLLCGIALVAASCDSESESESSKGERVGLNAEAIVVASVADLPRCNVLRDGLLAYVQDEQRIYACLDRNWIVAELDGDEGPPGPAG